MAGAEAACRLVVYPAREAPLAVVLRRGPSAWVRLSLWHTDTDRFEHGQWMKNRVYEGRCDLSADGSLFLSFVRGVPQVSTAEGGADSWLALSRPPYFTALALWFVGSTYYTGGWFPERRTLWHGLGAATPDQGTLPRWLRVTEERPPHVDGTPDWPNRTVRMNRLLRDGWRRVDGARVETWERPQPGGTETLVMTVAGPERDRWALAEYALVSGSGGELLPLGTGTWADWDQQGRLVLAREGRLLRWDGSGFVEIADFNPQRPEPEPAPAWATRWPDAPRMR